MFPRAATEFADADRLSVCFACSTYLDIAWLSVEMRLASLDTVLQLDSNSPISTLLERSCRVSLTSGEHKQQGHETSGLAQRKAEMC